jgi:hypothetical protein
MDDFKGFILVYHQIWKPFSPTDKKVHSSPSVLNLELCTPRYELGPFKTLTEFKEHYKRGDLVQS